MTEPVWLQFEVEGPPVPKARTRNRAGRHYTPARSAAAEEALALLIRSKRVVFAGDVSVLIEFRVKIWRGDVDNLAKLVLDALAKGGAIVNDRRVKRLCVEEVGSENERTIVWVGDWAKRVVE